MRGTAALVVLALFLLAGLGGGLVATRLLAQPEAPVAPVGGLTGLRFQQAVAELVLRSTGVSSRTEPVRVTQGELNAFLAHHVEGRRWPVRPLVVQAGEGRLALSGQTSLHQLGQGGGWAGWLVGWLPARVRDLRVWVAAEGRLEVQPGAVTFVVEGTTIGRQPVPPGWLWRALGLDPRELSWRLPRVVERIEVKPERLLIHTRPPRG
jgi:hypothetical protein